MRTTKSELSFEERAQLLALLADNSERAVANLLGVGWGQVARGAVGRVHAGTVALLRAGLARLAAANDSAKRVIPYNG